jgi:hypothetical protein
LLVHDGHHRLVATYLAGRAFLDPAEYRVTPWTFTDYLAVNFAAGWVTPFDPRTQVRTADFAVWKRQVLEAAQRDRDEAEQMIRTQSESYRMPRRYAGVGDLARDCCWPERDRWRQQRELTAGNERRT